jgi:hypothetical protein
VYAHGATHYEIVVRKSATVASVSVDGVEQPDGAITLAQDGKTHAVVVTWRS